MQAKPLVVLSIVLTGCADEFITSPEPVVTAESNPVAQSIVRVGEPSAERDTLPLLLQGLTVEEIESVEVIKSGSLAALYGSNTQCPAIIVRTRRP